MAPHNTAMTAYMVDQKGKHRNEDCVRRCYYQGQRGLPEKCRCHINRYRIMGVDKTKRALNDIR
jgi:hypothetical protein